MPAKRAHSIDSLQNDHKMTKTPSKLSDAESTSGSLARSFYPPEISDERCQQYKNGSIKTPYKRLQDTTLATKSQREAVKPRKAVMHWFKRDLRLYDNHALSMASELAQKANVPLLCLYIVSPEDFEAHHVSPARVDFDLRNLSILKSDLARLDIPLMLETVPKRADVQQQVLSICQQYDVSHVFANIEYEVDELRRESSLMQAAIGQVISFTAVHDAIAVIPEDVSTPSGTPYLVYTPWFKAWIKILNQHTHYLDAYPTPRKNPSSARINFNALFDAKVPPAPDSKKLTKEDAKRFRALWPAGEHKAVERLHKFVHDRIVNYDRDRNFPSIQATSSLSAHLSAGTLSARTAIRKAQESNTTEYLHTGTLGVTSWISEVAWRDFYKHVIVHFPYIVMYKPYKYEYSHLRWEYNLDHFDAWKQGKTGFPIVDAAMRQIAHTGYMHNRCRMIVASFFCKDLLLDWRLGEAYFHETLIDCDMASNNGGWTFCSSVGVAAQPYFRIFNPLLQSERFDPDGDYIRKWVPELAGVKGKAIHDPYGRGAASTAEKNHYPKPIVDHTKCRDRALERYKAVKG